MTAVTSAQKQRLKLYQKARHARIKADPVRAAEERAKNRAYRAAVKLNPVTDTQKQYANDFEERKARRVDPAVIEQRAIAKNLKRRERLRSAKGREKQRESSRRNYAAIRADPVRAEKERARGLLKYVALKADPERHRRAKVRDRARHDRNMADPIKKERERARIRVRNKGVSADLQAAKEVRVAAVVRFLSELTITERRSGIVRPTMTRRVKDAYGATVNGHDVCAALRRNGWITRQTYRDTMQVLMCYPPEMAETVKELAEVRRINRIINQLKELTSENQHNRRTADLPC